MSFFKQAEGEAAILVERGVYKQCDVYLRDGYIYAKTGGGFVKLMADGSTTKARCRLVELSWSSNLFRDGLGRLMHDPVGGMALQPVSGHRDGGLRLEGR